MEHINQSGHLVKEKNTVSLHRIQIARPYRLVTISSELSHLSIELLSYVVRSRSKVSLGYARIGSYLSHSQAAVFHNHLFHSRNHVLRSAGAWPRLLRVVFTRRSAFFELSHPRTHIFHVHNAITACLTQLSMNFDWFHATQVEESDNHALFFECKRRHFSMKNTTATRPRHKHSTGSTVLPLGLTQPKEQPRLLQQLSRFYLLPFPEKKIRIP